MCFRISKVTLTIYDTASGEMRPEFKATMHRLREWMQYSAALSPWSKCLEKRLETASEPGESCRSWSYYDPVFGDEAAKTDTGGM